MTALDAFNQLAPDEAATLLLPCCASDVWAADVAAARPFASVAALMQAADDAWQAVDDSERLQAFAAHPLIGDVELLRQKFAARANAEQGQVLAASEETLSALAELNQTYLDKFGFIFIICATGKSADEMLAQLRARLPNDRDQEIANAAREQAAITRLRLAQTIEDGPT